MRFKELKKWLGLGKEKETLSEPAKIKRHYKNKFHKTSKATLANKLKRDQLPVMLMRSNTSGVNTRLKVVNRPWSGKTLLDTRARTDGKPNCPECGHNRFKTSAKHGAKREIECRYCGDRRVV